MPTRAHLTVLVAVLAFACGGNVFSKGDDDGSGGKGTGGDGNGGMTSAGKAGSTGKAGTATGGSMPTAGGPSMGGAVPIGGGPNCLAVDCAFPMCADGAMPSVKPGECCPTCPNTDGCEAVKCEPVSKCGFGYTLSRPPGACCTGCFPDPGVGCREIACPQTECAPGYVRGDLVGGCCYDCVPDTLYCDEPADCVIADKPRSCCGCPEAITRRQYAEEPCWSEPGVMRMIPQSCYPQVTCDALCGACPDPGAATCIDHRCTQRGLGLK
jgi:hypothetical protein